MVEEARLEQLDTGRAPVSDGWFVVSVPDSAWVTNEALGTACIFEGFLVLRGECLLLIEGEERPLKAWDFVHCPPDTEHAFVGAGEGPCVIFMTGARKGWPDKGITYVRSEVALRHGAGVETETTKSAEAYAPFPKWQPGPPPSWAGLPWA
jgi:hypothetical protein